jgi:hypothetical protein
MYPGRESCRTAESIEGITVDDNDDQPFTNFLTKCIHWFYPLLVCPEPKQAHKRGDSHNEAGFGPSVIWRVHECQNRRS